MPHPINLTFNISIGVSKEDCLGEKDCHQGFVVAAPTNNNPDYYYHWQRDADVSMHVLQYTAQTNEKCEHHGVATDVEVQPCLTRNYCVYVVSFQ